MNRGVDFAGLVRGIREARGLTQEQLAHELGVTFGTVNGWENGRHRPIPLLARLLIELAAEAGVVTYPDAVGVAGLVADKRDPG